MKRFILGFILAISLPVLAAKVLWPSGVYLETFQNGFIFGTGKVLSVLNDVITFDGNRLDDRNKDIFYQEDFEGASVSFTCGTDLTAADETAAPIKGTSKSFTQGATPPAVGIKCESAAITLSPKEQDKNIVEVCFNSEWNGNNNEMALNVYGNTSAANLVQVPITASSTPKKHCGYFTTSGEASIDYHIEVLTQNANKKLLIDSIQFKVDPLAATDLYASSEWSTPEAITIGATTTAPTKGASPDMDEISYIRQGTNALIKFNYRQSAAGTSGSGNYLYSLPDGLEFASNVGFNTSTGTFLGQNDSYPLVEIQNGSTIAIGFVVPYDSTRFRFAIPLAQDGSGTGSIAAYNFNDSATFDYSNTNLSIKGQFSVPIAGWSDTAQGVVVKNRSDISSVENRFTIVVDNDDSPADTPAILSDPSGLFSVSRIGEGITRISWSTGLVSDTNYGVNIDSDSSAVCVSETWRNKTTTSVDVYTYNSSASAVDCNFDITITKGTDYIKETDKVYSLSVDNLTGNWCALSGNDGRAITAGSESMHYSGSCNGWTEGADGSTFTNGNYYTVQKNNSEIYLASSISDSGSTSSRGLIVYKNGSPFKRFGLDQTGGTNTGNFGGSTFLAKGETAAGDKISIGNFRSATLTNDTTEHYLTISEKYGDRGTFLGTFGQPTCYVYREESNGTDGGTASTSAWTKLTLNSTSGSCGFLSVSSSVLSIEAGTYNVDCSKTFYATGYTETRFRNTTSNVSIMGEAVYCEPTGANVCFSDIKKSFSITSQSNFEFQYYVTSGASTENLGIGNSGSGEPHIYGKCAITKVR